MSREDIIRMAREAGLLPILNEDAFQKWEWEKTNKVLEHFAALVAEAAIKGAPAYQMGYADGVFVEREACAKVCEDGVDTEHPTVKGHIMKNFGSSSHLAAAIRARGQA